MTEYKGIEHRFPKIDVLELTDDMIKFVLSETDLSVANVLRRVMIAETPILAIDLVEVRKNSTVLHDEFLAHRLGFIPLRHQDGINNGMFYARDCTCEDRCVNCSVIIDLKIKLPKGDPRQSIHITSRDLIPRPWTEYNQQTGREELIKTRVQPIHFASSKEESEAEDIGIKLATIRQGQELDLICVAKLGTGKEHAKWNPTAAVSMVQEPEVILNHNRLDELTLAQKEALVNLNSAGKVVVRDKFAVTYCNDLDTFHNDLRQESGDPELEDCVKIRTVPERFIFTVEVTGALTPSEVVLSALKIIEKKIEIVETQLKHEIENEGQNTDINGVVMDKRGDIQNLPRTLPGRFESADTAARPLLPGELYSVGR